MTDEIRENINKLEAELNGYNIYLKDTEDVVLQLLENLLADSTIKDLIVNRQNARNKRDSIEIEILKLQGESDEIIIEKENNLKSISYGEQSNSILSKYLNNLITQTGDFTPREFNTLAKSNLFPTWEANTSYTKGQRIQYNNIIYEILQNVTSLENQKPSDTGMLAIYSPLSTIEDSDVTGTIDNPIPFIVGMTVHEGLYYSYQNKLYLCNRDIIACVYPPDTKTLWQFSYIKDL